jgi:hypothetical protein
VPSYGVEQASQCAARHAAQLTLIAGPPKGERMADLAPTVAALRKTMHPFAARLDIKRDAPDELIVDTRCIEKIQKNKKPLLFGAVKLETSYVSFHLMPVYVQPALLAGLSPALRPRMQGMSRFSFAAVDRVRFQALAAPTPGDLRERPGTGLRAVALES